METRNNSEHLAQRQIDLRLGDNRAVLPTLADNSIDAIICDPPYEIAFMGSKWDASGIAYDVAMWAECLRVLKPGGHLLAFGGARTYHRLACAIEDAGFVIRDQIMWVFGSGFPKSHNVSKGIDTAAGAEREVIGQKDVGPDIRGDNYKRDSGERMIANITVSATDEAKQWEGFGTSLKPAHEPICMARKPFPGTIAANVLEWGTGAINIDGCRISAPEGVPKFNERREPGLNAYGNGLNGSDRTGEMDTITGRFPSNFIHDGSDAVLAGFPNTKSGGKQGNEYKRKSSLKYKSTVNFADRSEDLGSLYSDTGSAARFFYCAKASKTDRHEGLTIPGPQFTHGTTLRKVENTETKGNHHPTVKPTDLMQYLCRLVTPPGGVILDPFMGSGSTGKAAVKEGFSFIGIEQMPEYFAIAEARINHAAAKYGQQQTLLPLINDRHNR